MLIILLINLVLKHSCRQQECHLDTSADYSSRGPRFISQYSHDSLHSFKTLGPEFILMASAGHPTFDTLTYMQINTHACQITIISYILQKYQEYIASNFTKEENLSCHEMDMVLNHFLNVRKMNGGNIHESNK